MAARNEAGPVRTARGRPPLSVIVPGLVALAALAAWVPGRAATLAFLPCPSSDAVRVVDAADRHLAATIPVGGGPSGVLLSPDGSRAYVSLSREPRLAVVDTSSLKVVAVIPLPGLGRALALSPDGGRLVAGSAEGKEIWFVDTAAGRPLSRVGGFIGVSLVLFTPDGSRAVAADGAGRVVLLDGRRGDPGTSRDAGRGMADLVLSEDGGRLYIARAGAARLDMVDVPSLAEAGSIRLPRPATHIVLEEGGRSLLAVHQDRSLSRVDLQTRAVTPVAQDSQKLLPVLAGGRGGDAAAPGDPPGMPLLAALVPVLPPSAPPAAESFLATLGRSTTPAEPGPEARLKAPAAGGGQAGTGTPAAAPPPPESLRESQSIYPKALPSGGEAYSFTSSMGPESSVRLPGSQGAVGISGGAAPETLSGMTVGGTAAQAPPPSPGARQESGAGAGSAAAPTKAPEVQRAKPTERTQFYWFWLDGAVTCLPPPKGG